MIENQMDNFWSNLFYHPTLHKALSGLTDYQKEVVKSVIIEDIPETEYARSRGISQQAISKSKLTALKMLRKAVGKEG